MKENGRLMLTCASKTEGGLVVGEPIVYFEILDKWGRYGKGTEEFQSTEFKTRRKFCLNSTLGVSLK